MQEQLYFSQNRLVLTVLINTVTSVQAMLIIKLQEELQKVRFDILFIELIKFYSIK